MDNLMPDGYGQAVPSTKPEHVPCDIVVTQADRETLRVDLQRMREALEKAYKSGIYDEQVAEEVGRVLANATERSDSRGEAGS